VEDGVYHATKGAKENKGRLNIAKNLPFWFRLHAIEYPDWKKSFKSALLQSKSTISRFSFKM